MRKEKGYFLYLFYSGSYKIKVKNLHKKASDLNPMLFCGDYRTRTGHLDTASVAL